MNFTDLTEQLDINSLVSKFKQQTLLFRTEEDVRAETNAFLRELCKKHNIRLSESSGHEVSSVHGGRADSMYSNIIFEYKAPSVDLTKKKGIDEVIDGRDEHDHGLKHYLINFSLEEHTNSNNEIFRATLWKKIGIGFNGKSFILADIPPRKIANLICLLPGRRKIYQVKFLESKILLLSMK